jgi:hypothetical protein
VSEVWRPSVEQADTDGMRRLWAPWRSAYIAGEVANDACPFCELPRRDDDRDSDVGTGDGETR